MIVNGVAHKYILEENQEDSSVVYEGWSKPGTETSESAWRIRKTSTVKNLRVQDYAGDGSFEHSWDTRLELFNG